ncbi:sulfotransferase [Sphingomonas sp.]|uniref:sulfotransferase n=1 Tax=Sphingomonas sp. TaxID=28214 RepID=UPI0031E00F66
MNADGWDVFGRAILANPALQERLGAIELPDAFEAEAHAVAAASGIVLPVGATPGRPVSVEFDCWPDTGWLPARTVPGTGAPAFDWIWFGARPLVESFYRDSALRMGTRPLSRTVRPRTDMAALVAGASREGTLAPQGFIFHMSRCGSTLVAQMLAAVPHHAVVSEAEPIDAIVQWTRDADVPFEDKLTALRAIVAALGRNRDGLARRYFVKLDSWHVLALPLFRAAFPEVPWIFLYRDPAEVLVSQMRMPGLHVAASLPGVEPAADFSLETHGAKVLAKLLTAVAEHLALGRGMLVDYAELPYAMEASIPGHFGFAPDAGEARAMAAARARDAKAPGERFVADVARKRAAVTPAIAAAVERFLDAPYARLKSLRTVAR